MSKKGVNMGAEFHKEEIHRGSDHYIWQVDTPDGHILWVTNDMCVMFQQHFLNGNKKLNKN